MQGEGSGKQSCDKFGIKAEVQRTGSPLAELKQKEAAPAPRAPESKDKSHPEIISLRATTGLRKRR